MLKPFRTLARPASVLKFRVSSFYLPPHRFSLQIHRIQPPLGGQSLHTSSPLKSKNEPTSRSTFFRIFLMRSDETRERTVLRSKILAIVLLLSFLAWYKSRQSVMHKFDTNLILALLFSVREHVYTWEPESMNNHHLMLAYLQNIHQYLVHMRKEGKKLEAEHMRALLKDQFRHSGRAIVDCDMTYERAAKISSEAMGKLKKHERAKAMILRQHKVLLGIVEEFKKEEEGMDIMDRMEKSFVDEFFPSLLEVLSEDEGETDGGGM
ncbi:hypothetical protein BDQ17DRAFT_1374060 [Cyathus striatus]|nr:hypothetical protein BDQ17DRAFT_1374060 [Cyathus striatus]